MLTLTNKEARNIILTSQGLVHNSFGNKKAGTQNAIEHLGYIQIDTISVVERAHHHTIWSRVNDYHKKYLDELVEDKKVFEYWSHAAAYLPMRDYRFSLMRKTCTLPVSWGGILISALLNLFTTVLKPKAPCNRKILKRRKNKAAGGIGKKAK
ncbi:MAG TPA: crosslink repair DNA glycosylase YcaQ family protein [Chitinophagales bacterium]|nr:crosslink repair DNA glycosylase YcaQ family protein [Chitinophagales bacterium]